MSMAQHDRGTVAVPERLLRKGRAWQLAVTGTEEVTPNMRRVRATGDELIEFAFRAGQSLILVLPQPDGSTASRHYTIRAFDAATRELSIDVVLHGETPANRWARSAAPGDLFAAVGPRGQIKLKDGYARHLLLADETALPAVLAILEALPDGQSATALVEIPSDVDRQTVPERDGIEIVWLVRSANNAPGSLVSEKLAERRPTPHDLHVYIAGETSAVRSQRQSLLAAGFDKADISAEGYWRPDRIGGHDHVDD